MPSQDKSRMVPENSQAIQTTIVIFAIITQMTLYICEVVVKVLPHTYIK